MAVRLTKPWMPLTTENVAKVGGHLGVYQLATATGEIVYIGVAGGKSPFGLKGALADALLAPPAGTTQFRYEITMAYRTRHIELLEAYQHDYGCLPVGNRDIDPASLGRLRLG